MIDPNAIAALKVYPPIGVARVGNAQGAGDYVIGPEMIGGASTLPARRRNSRLALSRTFAPRTERSSGKPRASASTPT